MREEEARMDLLHDNHMEEAETTERQARVAKEEAARLETGERGCYLNFPKI